MLQLHSNVAVALQLVGYVPEQTCAELAKPGGSAPARAGMTFWGSMSKVAKSFRTALEAGSIPVTSTKFAGVV